MSAIDVAPASRPNLLASVDRITERIGDRLNPILVKESRQALKSRQFVLTFSLLLVAAWGWTATAIVMLMPGIYYVPSGDTFLYGYYLVLAVPMLMVVPLAAHRSLASEVDDGTLDLLSVTTLSPLQIITGKLASAALQMMLYLVALFPCVAFCYVLRGVDLLTIGCVLGLVLTVATLLTVVGLFLAALPGGRAGQLGMLVSLLVVIVIAEFACGSLAFGIIDQGFRESPQGFVYAVLTGVLFTVTLSVILLRAAAAELSPPSENRSSPIRRALLWHQSLMIGCLAYGMLSEYVDGDVMIGFIYYAAAFWTLVGTLMVGESSFLTPRVRRDLPSSFLTRGLFVWITPGPSTGLVFSILAFGVFAVCVLILDSLRPVTGGFVGRGYVDPMPDIWALSGYMMLFMAATRGCMYLIRLRNNTRPALALAVLVIVAGAFALVPYFIALHWNDYRSISWSYAQLTNWPWTMAILMDRRLGAEVPLVIFTIGCIAMSIVLLSAGRRMLPLRVETPQRVLEEQRRQHDHAADVLFEPDPLAS